MAIASSAFAEGSRTRCGLDVDSGSEAEVTFDEVISGSENLIAGSLFSGTKVSSLYSSGLYQAE